MLDRILGLFRGKAVIVRGTGKLAEGHAKKVEFGDVLAGGKAVLLCRVEGPLVEGKLALCPLHNYTFEPATGRVVRGSCPKATVYKVAEKDGDAEVWI
jgi:hypothetical protein